MLTQMTRIAATVLLLLVAPWQLSLGAELRLFTEEYPPITFSRNGKVSGLGSEVVAEIQRRVGSAFPIEMVPWARGYRAALKDANTVLFATMRTTERELLFKWVGPLTTVTTSFYAKRGSNVAVTSLLDAKAIEGLLVPRDYYSHQFLQSKGFGRLYAVTSPEQMAVMLMAGRSQLMATDNLTLASILAYAGASVQDVVLVSTFMQSQNYIAFSHDTPDLVVQQWQRALDQMKQDGAFAKIYTKWLPTEVPPGIKPSAAWTEEY